MRLTITAGRMERRRGGGGDGFSDSKAWYLDSIQANPETMLGSSSRALYIGGVCSSTGMDMPPL
jgi:hypothetical protein